MLLSLWEKWREIALFGLIGVANTLVHGLMLASAIECLQLPLMVSHTLAFCIANMFSYALNSRITFKITLSAKRYTRFFIASLVALMLTLGIAAVADHFGFDYRYGFAMVVFTVPTVSFVLIKFWVFTQRRMSS